MKKLISVIAVVMVIFSFVSVSASASSGYSFIIASTNSYNYGGYGYKNDTAPADVKNLTTQNITQGMRYILKSGSTTSSTLISGLTDRYDSYDFTISYIPGYATSGNKHIWGNNLGSSSYTVKSTGTFYA